MAWGKQGREAWSHDFRRTMPDQLEVALGYADTQVINPGALTYAGEHAYRLNSLYDPDYTGGGHQPYGFDQWSAFYNRYRVDKVELDLKMINNNSASAPIVVYVANNSLAAAGTLGAVENYIESPFSDFSICGASLTQLTTHFKKTFYPRLITGVPKAKYISDDLYQATVGANPTENIILHTFISDAGTSVPIVITVLRLTYFVTFWDRNNLSSSVPKLIEAKKSSTSSSSDSGKNEKVQSYCHDDDDDSLSVEEERLLISLLQRKGGI